MSVVNVSLRECLLVTGRVLRLTGLARGAVPAVRDTVVTAEGVGLGGLRALRDGFDHLCETAGVRPVAHAEPERIGLRANDLHALVLAPNVLDLAVAAVHRHGQVLIEVEGALVPHLLGVLEAMGPDYGVALSVDPPDSAVGRRGTGRGAMRLRGRILPPTTVARPSPLDGILRRGTDVDTELWWDLFHLGNRLLTPDSAVSRRHAGRSVFDENGQVLGELGEDWYEAPTPTPTPAS